MTTTKMQKAINAKANREQKEYSLKYLKENLKENDTVYTVLEGVGSSGMTRRIKTLCIIGGEIRDITWHVANACGFRFNDKKNTLTVHGCGMDMGYHVVYSLAGALEYTKKGLSGYDYESNCYGLGHRWL